MAAQKWCVLGCFGYHGNLLVFFGPWFLVYHLSNFVRRYSTSGLESALRGLNIDSSGDDSIDSALSYGGPSLG